MRVRENNTTKGNKMNNYYGFEYWDSSTTTTGEPNKITGRSSIAGDMVVFSSREDLETWVSGGSLDRKKCTVKELRNLNLGLSFKDFEDELDRIKEEIEF